MITFKNIAGNKFLAVGTIQRKSALNGEKSLTGTLYDGKDVLNKIGKGWSLEFDGEPYVVTYFERNDNDNSVSFDAIHKFFWDMAKKVLYSSTEISGSHTIKWYLDQIFANTGYTYALNFSPAAIEKDNWGNKTRLSLFNDLIKSIAGEFEINGTLISIFQNIGTDLSTIVRYGFNLSDMTLENDATSFVTYGEGFGAYANQENQTGDRVHVTYTSPLAGVYGILQAEPIDDQRYTSQANLQAAVKSQVDASFSVSVQLSLYDLTAAGYPYKMANVGDWLTAVDENLDFKQRIRIISIDDEFSADGTRISYTVTAGDVGLTKKYQDANASMASQVANAVASASQAATDANNALISANGKNTSYYLNSVDDLPTTANEGDLAWVKSGDGTVMYIYTKKTDGSYYWEKRIDPEMGDQIAAGVTDAVSQANAHTDEVKQGLSSDIATAKSQAASQASTAEANAKSAATSQFNQAKDALAEAKANLQSDIDESKGNIVEINKTLTGFDGTLQRVQDAVNGLGQTNQLINTEFTPDLQGWNDQTLAKTGVGTFNGSNILDLSGNSDFRQLFIPLNGATIVSASVYRKISISGGSGGRWSLMFYGANNAFISSVYGTYQTSLPDFTLEKLENVSVPSGAQSVSLRFYLDGTVSIYQIVQPMLVFESTVGTYVQGNYNNNDALAKVKLTADQASLDLSTYQTDADGRISKAQTGVEANATAITQKVSQTDYDKKTGDLSTKLNTTTDTADSTKQALSDYKEYANGNISGVASDLSKLAGEVDLKLTKTDYDNDQSILNTSLSQWKADYDGWTGTVTKLSTKVNNLGQVNQLFNTEFSPDLQGWYASPNLSSQSYPTINTLLVKSNLSYSGSNAVMIDYSGQTADYAGYTKMYQDIVNVYGHSIVSWSMAAYLEQASSNGNTYFNATIDFFDKDMTFISNAAGKMFEKTKIGSWQNSSDNSSSFLNVAVPVNAYYAGFKFYPKGQFKIHLSKPMIIFDSPTVGAYVAGAYNNNAALAQVKITADSISNFVRDSSGNISSYFQTALSKTSIITGSTLATSIQTQTSTQISSAITDNNGKIISLINQDTSGVQIAGKNIVLDGNTTVTGEFYAKGGNFKNLNASNMTVGTLNGSQVNITNINASNIVTGALTGITLMSSADGSQFKVQGNNLQMVKQNGDNLQLSTSGLFWKDSSGNVLFEASNKLMTSDIFGTAEYNVYLASSNETRSVTYKTALTGSGGVSDYVYVPHRSSGLYANWLEVNASGSAHNIYIRPLKAESEVRITASGGTDSYANLRARYVYADRIANNSFTNSNHLYLQTNDEVRVKTTNDDVDNSGYQAIRASAFNSASLAEYKQNINVSDISGLDEINKSTIYNYQLKTSPDKQEVGLVIGDGYDISQIVVDGDGVNQYRMVTIAWKAIQELTQQVNELKQELERKVA
ncbi:phage tail protein [Leuconostoc falkenbergense]|uniref:phage tail protein n=1 Tax=Leuconostoc falkenbergense TaxID=2766470 RepID=UPI0029588822|nr:phage tail protein [Leuconostoc falkenbergense]MDV8951214.1 hypothetical protein [Leuconostoc falkenbergense]